MAITTLAFAEMANDTYVDGGISRLLGEWQLQDLITRDNFHARAYKHTRASLAVVAYRGTVPTSFKDVVVADLCGIGLSLNALALNLNTAIDFTGKIKAMYRDVWLTGHSLGGAYVQLLAAICELPGYTFNAPGVLNLLHQMSPNLAVRIAGGLGGGALSVLSRGTTDLITQVAAGVAGNNGEAILNYRGNFDPVSLVGVHVGAPLQTIELVDQKPHVHSMEPIIRTLKGR
ncbi:hypothetical protein GON01_02415 [Sphingomonas sp. MAH-20]|uniref:Fungal lipase-like domain-containing protein n=1 Tax=Sphingomonas horti TaxID=2682842 RepID=A0A6I4IXH0_9SPHN|nr:MULTISPECIES: hypothetical protein [Sphingomonas]MBA2920543.1 hypothetical protein [Sphingomonas sp. CGMCC 1.13658]MVO76795.1 hypothetical protein [Sphingomonas horti]